MLERWVHWLYKGLICPVLKTAFYITDAEGFRNRVFYYRKPVWAEVRRLQVRGLCRRQFDRLTDAEAATILSGTALHGTSLDRGYGAASVRFVPRPRKGG